MHYYIDGYNLLFRILRAGDDLRTQREQITTDIEVKTAALDVDATLVFDSHYQEDDSTRSHLRNLEIVFSALGETADEYILQEIKESQNPSHHTVVTSDKKLAHLCRLRLAKTESVEEFLSSINKRYKNKLSQRKKPEPQTLAPPPPKIAPKPAHFIPKADDSAESCFDFYLNSFEDSVKLIESQTPPKPPPKPKKISAKQSKKIKSNESASKEDSHLSDMERWQNAFENGY
jgi:Predicted RNA-binding protein containing a PIN domain